MLDIEKVNRRFCALAEEVVSETVETDVVETEDTFTISGSEDEITLTLVESKTVTNGQTQTGTAISNMLLAFYTTTEKTITLSK